MFGPHVIGVGLGLAAAFLWALSPMFFASAGRRIGSFHVVLLRSLLASAVLLVGMAAYGTAMGWPWSVSRAQVTWLVVSGVVGMVLGDLLIYESWVLLGARRGSQTRTIAPVVSVMVAAVWLDERLSLWTLGGIVLVLAGTSYAVLARQAANEKTTEPGRVTALGLLVAFGGAVCEGLGAVTARHAFTVGPGNLDPFVATTIRVVSAGLLLWILPVLRGRAGQTLVYLRDRIAMSRIVPGTFVGPLLGILCYLVALKHLEAGPVSTLTAMSPLFVIPMVAVRYRTRFGVDVVAASVLAVGGVALICLR